MAMVVLRRNFKYPLQRAAGLQLQLNLLILPISIVKIPTMM